MKRIIPLSLVLCLFNVVNAPARQLRANEFAPSAQHSESAPSLAELTASEALDLIERGELTSEEYVAALLERADSLSGLNVFISRDAAAALAAAREADRRRALGLPCGRLCGLPLIVKDNINSAALPTTGGTPALVSNRPTTNAVVLQRLLDEGAILLGKSNMHELAFGATSNNAFFGAVRNPYDVSRIPGGSSGGTAAAVAARIVPAGLGTDTAGSVRVPAALTGTVGFRPSAGRYSTDGLILISQTQDRAGTHARTVRDLVLLDRVLSEVGSRVRPLPLRRMRLGVDRANFVANVDPELIALFDKALDELRGRGVEVVEVSVMPRADFLATINALRFSIGFYEAPANLANYLQGTTQPLALAQLAAQVASPDVRQIFFAFLVPGAPLAVTPQAYQAGLAARARLRSAYQSVMTENELDALVFPTTPLAASPIGQEIVRDPAGNFVPATLAYTQNVVPASYAGLAGLSLPLGLTSAGLPVGLELDGLEGSDEKVLGVGLSIEKVLRRLPPPPLP
ncbi:MAG TPA: indoleacetamide hydrolase [Pyrinomonadaceae bacterium]|nr:indoleacetamide hydrolase [Pyrinomonadaceae bacterium]